MNKTELISMAMLNSLKPASSGPDYVVRDTQLRGFGVRVSAGSVSYFVQKKMKQLRVSDNGAKTYVRMPTKRTLGYFSGGGRGERLALSAARARAQIWLGLMTQGTDPLLEREQNKKKTAEAWVEKHAIFGLAFEDFCKAREASSAPGTIKDRKKAVTELSDSRLFATPIRDVDVQIIEESLRPIFTHSLSNGWRCYRWCRVAYKTAASRLKIYGNPFSEWRADKKPKQVLSRKELLDTESEKGRKWLRTLGRLRCSKKKTERVAADYILSVLLLGTRKTETQLLKVDDLDFKKGTARLRQENTKARVPRTIPLGSFASKILQERIRANGKDSDWVFPSRQDKKCVVDIRVTLYAANKAAGIEQNKIRLHDLRRTFASELLAESRGNLFLVKSALGHSESQGDITVRYLDDAEILRQLRPLIERREKRLEALTQAK